MVHHKRAFADNYLGKIDYEYSDINSTKMPNFIIRSKIDHLRNADHYDPYWANKDVNTETIREYAQKIIYRSN